MALDPVTAALDFGTKLLGIGSELVEDKDKKNEFIFKAQEMHNDFLTKIATMQTTPKVDAAVKLILVAKEFVRPIGSCLMTAFGMYCHYKQIPMDTGLHAVFDGALPAWGVSRHMEKGKEKKGPDLTGLP